MFDGIKNILSKVVESGAREIKTVLDDKLDDIADNAKKARVRCPIYFTDQEEKDIVNNYNK